MLNKSETNIQRQKKWKNINEYNTVDKSRYEIQEQKEVPVWYTGMCWPISSTGYVINYDAELKNVTAAL
jgi:hypothetical protein